MLSMVKNALYVLGDIGYLNYELFQCVQHIVNDFKSNDKLILMGDNFYPVGVKSSEDAQWMNYRMMFSPIGFKNIFGVMGNHDYEGDPNIQINSPYMWNTDFYYKYSLSKDTELFFIDTVPLYENHCGIQHSDMRRIHDKTYFQLQMAQLYWLENHLSESTAKNKIVFGHYPIITNGFYKERMDQLKETLFEIFKENEVTAYVSGHEHNIQYIKKEENNYMFHQFIIGSSSDYRSLECPDISSENMYDNTDNYYLKIQEQELTKNVEFQFINKQGDIKHKYVI